MATLSTETLGDRSAGHLVAGRVRVKLVTGQMILVIAPVAIVIAIAAAAARVPAVVPVRVRRRRGRTIVR